MSTFTKDQFPEQMTDLNKKQRALAIERANALVDAGASEWRAIAMAVTFARESEHDSLEPDKLPGPAIHVMYDQGKRAWTLCPEGNARPTHSFDDLVSAVTRASEIAGEASSAVYVYGEDGAVVEKYESFGSALPADGALHVIPTDDAWALKREGADGLFEPFDTKAAAVDAGRSKASELASALVIHYQSGPVENQHTY